MSPTSTRPGGYETAIATDDRLISFLYGLMRDHLTPGMVEALVVEMEDADEKNEQQTVYAFSNDFLAAYAIEIAARLNMFAPAEAAELAHSELAIAQRRDESAEEEQGDPPLPRIPQLERAEERR